MRRKSNVKVPQFILYLALKYAWPTITVSACIQCNFDVYVKISFEISHYHLFLLNCFHEIFPPKNIFDILFQRVWLHQADKKKKILFSCLSLTKKMN